MTTERRRVAVIATLVLVLSLSGRVTRAEEPAAPTAPPTTAPVDASPPPTAEGSAAGSAAPLVESTPEVPELESTTRTFAGSIQLDYLAVPTDRDARQTTFDGATAEVSLKVTKDFSKNASATVKVCFACHGFELGMGFIELRATDELRLRVGRMTPSFGSFPQRHDPANHLTSDKPLPYDMGRMLARDAWNEGVLPAPWVDNGIELGGTHFWNGGQVDYAVFAVSGPKGGPDASDFDFTLSRAPEQYYVDNNSEPVLGGRIAVALDLSETTLLTVGASAMAGRYDPARDLSFAIAGADLTLKLDRLYLRAEYLIRRTQMALGDEPATRFKYGPGANGAFADHFLKDGFYAELEAPFGRVTALARWDGLRRAGNVLATSPLTSSTYLLRYTAGLAYRLRSKILLKTSVELYQFKELADELALHLGLATAF